MGDGSEWIWNIADQHFPGATQIVDLYHAGEHLWDLARKLHSNQEAERRRWIMIHQDLLEGGKIEDLAAAFGSIEPSSSELAEKIRIETGYFEKNAKRMRYPEFRRQHLFVGTGGHRSRLQNRNWFPLQAVGDVLDCAGSQRDPGTALKRVQLSL